MRLAFTLGGLSLRELLTSPGVLEALRASLAGYLGVASGQVEVAAATNATGE